VLAFFVGNGEDLRSAARWAAMLAQHGLQVVVPEYPGYGLSAGRPSVAALYEVADATAAHAERLARMRGVPLLLGGSSMGTFCATHAAAAHPPARLLLVAAPTTMVAAAAARFWWLPVGLLLAQRFDNVANAAAVRCPVLLLHGDADAVVPLRLGRELAAVFGARARLRVVPGCGHNDLPLDPGSTVGGEVRSFLRGE